LGKGTSKAADRRADSRTLVSGGSPAWLRADADGVSIQVHLQPGARRTAVCGEHGGRLKIAVAAPPLQGRANDALIEWVARRLALPRRQVRLVAGEHSRDKTLRADGASAIIALRALGRE
jgi:uncharacterized protein (TIGR00251 family)